MKPKQLSNEQWRELFKLQQQSGLSQAAFCRQHALANSTFSNKRKILLSSSQPYDVANTSFIQLKPVTPATTSIHENNNSIATVAETSTLSTPDSTMLLLRYQQAELSLCATVSPRWLATLLREITR